MPYRRLGFAGALMAALIVSAGTAVAAGSTTTPDLTFTAVGTGDTVAAAQSAAAAAVQTEENGFVQRTGAACGGTLSSSRQQFQLNAGGSAVALSIGVYCGPPTVSADAVLFYGFGTGDTQSGVQDVAVGAASSNESTYQKATGAACTPSLAAEGAQTWQLTQGWAGLGSYPADCQASTSGNPPPPIGCHVTYAPNNWLGGFTANVTIANTGQSAINGWALTFTFPGDQRITGAWEAAVTQTGASVTATNLSYNAAIAPGGSQSFGFQGTWFTGDSAPASFTVNGSTCT